MTRLLAASLLLLLTLSAQAGKIYRCTTDDDRIEFSDRPCGNEVDIRDDTSFGGSAPLRRPVPAEALPPPQTYEEWQQRKADHDAAKSTFDERIEAIDLRLLDIKSQLIPMIDQGAPDEDIEALSAEERDLQSRRRSLSDERRAALDRLDPGIWIDPSPDDDQR